jgi:hypothetical protein
VLELGQEEVRHDPADERSAAPDIAALAGHVPSGGVEHLGCEVDHGNFCNVLFLSVSDGLYLWDEENFYVSSTADTSAQSTETHSRRFCNDGVGDRSHGSGENERDQDSQYGLSVVC